MAKYNEKQKEWARQWDAKNLDRISIALPIGTKERIRSAAGDKSVNAYLNEIIMDALEKAEE